MTTTEINGILGEGWSGLRQVGRCRESSGAHWAQSAQVLHLQAASQDIWADSRNPARRLAPEMRLAVKGRLRGSLHRGRRALCHGLHLQDRRTKLITVVLLLPTQH